MTPRQAWSTLWPPLAALTLALGVAEGVVRSGLIASFLIPPPTAAVRALVEQFPTIRAAFFETLIASLVGFAMSAVLGVATAVILSSGGLVRRALLPYAVVLQTVPIVALAPLLAIWFDYGIGAVIASSFVASVFPVIANTLAGLLSTDVPLIDLFRLYRAGRVATLLKLRLPFALPQIFTGLRVAAGLAVIGAIVGEFITGSGLGGLMQVARQQRRIDTVFATLFAASLLGIAMFAIINLAARLSLRHWHASERPDERT